jgi:hypothetical protein
MLFQPNALEGDLTETTPGPLAGRSDRGTHTVVVGSVMCRGGRERDVIVGR